MSSIKDRIAFLNAQNAAAANQPAPVKKEPRKFVPKPAPAGAQPAMVMPFGQRMSQARLVYNKYDEKKDGHIDIQTFRRMCMIAADVHLTNEQAQMVMKLIDKDGNGTIEFEEFEEFWKKNSSGESRFEKCNLSEDKLEFLKGAFDFFIQFDDNGNGLLDKDEFPDLYKALAEEYDLHAEADEWKEMDRDGSGSICFAEYVEWLDRKLCQSATF